MRCALNFSLNKKIASSTEMEQTEVVFNQKSIIYESTHKMWHINANWHEKYMRFSLSIPIKWRISEMPTTNFRFDAFELHHKVNFYTAGLAWPGLRAAIQCDANKISLDAPKKMQNNIKITHGQH